MVVYQYQYQYDIMMTLAPQTINLGTRRSFVLVTILAKYGCSPNITSLILSRVHSLIPIFDIIHLILLAHITLFIFIIVFRGVDSIPRSVIGYSPQTLHGIL